MTNISTVYGDYTFDFKDTDTNAQEQLAWLIELSRLLMSNIECKTDFFCSWNPYKLKSYTQRRYGYSKIFRFRISNLQQQC